MVMVAVLWFAIAMLAPARAAMVTYDVTFSASNFRDSSNNLVALCPVIGEFIVSFDTLQTYTNATTGLTLKSLNVALSSQLGFNYYSTQELQVGGIDVSTLIPKTNDFLLNISNILSRTPVITNPFGYTVSTQAGYFWGTVTGIITPVPLPPTVLLVGSGLLGLAGGRRFRKG